MLDSSGIINTLKNMDSEEFTPELPNEVVKNALKEIIKRQLKSDNYSINIERGSSKGDNYIGIIYRATITLNNDNNNSNKSLSIIIKVPPQNEIRRKLFFARPSFLREALVYNEIIPMFLKFQKDKNITPFEKTFHEVPECYDALTDDGYETIFLRDLRCDGFEMFSRFDILTVDHVNLVMKILGKLHALSFALRDQKPEILDKYKSMKDILTEREDDDNLRVYFEGLKQRAFDILSPIENKELLEKLKQYFGDHSFMDLLQNLVKGELVEPYAVLCHGDCWNNNVLYKYKDKKPIDARLIDWQITRYSSPVCDLTYFLFSCTSKELRDKHYHEFLDTYYNELCDLLKRLGSDPEKLFPRKAFDQQLKKIGRFGLLMAMALLPIFTSEAEDIPDLDELAEKFQEGNINPNESFNAERTMDIYKKRMKDVMVDIVSLGYL